MPPNQLRFRVVPRSHREARPAECGVHPFAPQYKSRIPSEAFVNLTLSMVKRSGQ